MSLTVAPVWVHRNAGDIANAGALDFHRQRKGGTLRLRSMKFYSMLGVTAVIASWIAIPESIQAEAVKDREGAVRQDREKMQSDARWIYNDVARGFAEAKKSGRPLMVVLRCVPCLACAGIDASVLLQENELAPLLDQFVCVRVINANSLDLSMFQVDWDLSFSTMFFHGDGTVYGRFGSWKHQKDPQDKTTASFKAAMNAVLALHQQFPDIKSKLVGKQGAPLSFRSPLEIPPLAGKYQRELNWEGKVVASCLHCHQVGDALRSNAREKKQPMPLEWVYPMPAPEVAGFSLSADQAATVEAVIEGGVAAKAGLKPSDRILELNGQPPISSADVSWVLHRAGEAANIPLKVLRDGKEQSMTLHLETGWRRKADISRRVGTWQLRGMATGGLVLEDLPDAEREERKLGLAALALKVKFVGQFDKHAAAKRAGFQKDDVLVEVGDIRARMGEGEMLGYLLERRFPGDSVKVAVMRGTQRLELMLPMQ